MFAIVGLGNPGSKYEQTRHNAGFWVIERLSRQHSISSWKSKFDSEFATGEIAGQKVLLAMPQTYMNESGAGVAPLCKFYNIDPSHLIVVHDELDLGPGCLRVKLGGSSGGHNGVEDIASRIGSKNFFRVRVGIGRPPGERRGGVSSWVLSKADSSEQTLIDEAVVSASEAIECLILEGIEKTQRKFNTNKQQ